MGDGAEMGASFGLAGYLSSESETLSPGNTVKNDRTGHVFL